MKSSSFHKDSVLYFQWRYTRGGWSRGGGRSHPSPSVLSGAKMVSLEEKLNKRKEKEKGEKIKK